MAKDLPDNLREIAEKRALGPNDILPGRGGSSFALGFDEMAHIPARDSGSGRTIGDVIDEHRREYLATMIDAPYAHGHKIIASATNMICTAREWMAREGASVICGSHATHKVGEEGGDPLRHNLTTYVCCEHFRSIMGRCE